MKKLMESTVFKILQIIVAAFCFQGDNFSVFSLIFLGIST